MAGVLEMEYQNLSGNLARPEAAVYEGQVAWVCPTNIALVKYWGKRPGQLPMNPSLSMTLDQSGTHISVNYKFNPSKEHLTLSYAFENKVNHAFGERCRSFLETAMRYMPFLNHLELDIRSENTIPHSAGLASSASAFAALALAICDIENILFGTLHDPADFKKKASFIARLGSGSACRSMMGSYALWGKTDSYLPSSPEAAVSLDELIHPVFMNYSDSILIIDKDAKEVSSSAGHRLMENHPFSGARIIQSHENIARLLAILSAGDTEDFAGLVQEEALTLHAMMMTSRPGYTLMKPKSLEAISRIRNFRQKSGLNVAFTMDAGANVNVLYPAENLQEVRSFIKEKLEELCVDGMVIHDHTGRGPVKTQ